MPRLLSGIVLLFWFCPVLASFSPAVSFFRTPQSLFESGQARLDVLENSKRAMQTLNFYWVQKDGRKLRLSAKTVCRDLDLAFKVLNTTTGLTGFIQRYESPWYQVKYEKEVLWNSSDQLVPAPDDLGVALVHQSHPLRKTPTWKDNTNQAAWALERYQVLGFENKFIKVRSLANHLQEGYLEPGAVLLKVDFASFIMSNVKSWQAFQHREGNTLVLKNNTRVDIENLSSMMTKPELGILNQKAGSENLTARSTVEIKRGEWIQWAESDLKGHGRIFWKRSEHKPIGRKRSSYLSTEDVLEKTFFQSAIHPEKPDEALVSANGVFYTQDGKNWRGLATFNQENLPVAFGLNGELFVGNFRSTDRGQTFQPYLRWEDLTGLIEKRHKRTPGVLKISEVKVEQPGKIQITLDTGVLKAWLVGSVRYGLVTDWKVLKEQ